MRIPRKSSRCLNCNHSLDKVYNYCPNCGQGNHNDNVSFKTLAGDFFSTYLAVDSKFGRTFRPFFTAPGYLTNQYIAGKRAQYAHPVRLYLIISIFFFFVFNMAAKREVMNENDEIIKVNETLKTTQGLDPETRKKISSLLRESTIEQLNDSLKSKDIEDLKPLLHNLSEKNKKRLQKGLTNEELLKLGIIPDSTIIKSDQSQPKNKNKITVDPGDESGDHILSKIDWNLIKGLKDKREYSDQDILDSMNLKDLSAFESYIATQAIRVNRADGEQVSGYILNNLPLMMLVLIPIFALVLKLLYIRRKQLYIKHVINALHIHSFAYFTYGVGIILLMYVFTDETSGPVFGVICFFLVSTYAFISFLKVYKQHWFKTLIKFNLVGIIYLMAITVFLVFEVMISFLLY